MDGIDHSFAVTNAFTEPLYGYSRSEGVHPSGVVFDFESEEVQTRGKFSDFELFLMGLPPMIGTPADRKLQVVEPHWVFPLDFHAGLYTELENGQTWYHGFYKRLDHIQAKSADSSGQGSLVPLTSPFDPYNRVALRIVQQGVEVELQVRVWKPKRISPEEGCLYWITTKLGGRLFRAPAVPPDLTAADILSEPHFTSSDDVPQYGSWRKVARLPSRAVRVGLAARHTSHRRCFARIRPRLLCLLHNDVTSVVTPQDMVLENEPSFEDDSWGSTVLNDGSLVLPYRVGPEANPVLGHNDQEDKAPRLVVDAPVGDFVFGGEIELCQSVIVSWAGWGGTSRSYVGHRREVAFEDAKYLAHWGPEYESVRQAEPHGGAYRFLFCLVSESALEESDLTAQLVEVDRIRRAWKPCFDAFTSGRRGALTAIPFP
jgi:hypothetical protein